MLRAIPAPFQLVGCEAPQLYAYTRAYDPVSCVLISHAVLCADLTCSAPAADEIREPISTQMSAAIVQSDSVTVTRTGNGNVASSDKRIACGNFAAGTVVTLTATPEPGFTFVNWSGACTGTAASCAVTVTGSATAQANFTR